MRRAAILPLSALVVLSAIHILVALGWLPPPEKLLNQAQSWFGPHIYWFAFLVILLESIVYVGFYFPGQFFAVLLVVGMQPGVEGVLYLTVAMVAAATLGSLVNYQLGFRRQREPLQATAPTKLRHLLLAMVHINALAFFMFNSGLRRASPRVVLLAGLLNLPYYLLLIGATSAMSEQVGRLAENSYFLFLMIGLWLAVVLVLDYKKFGFASAKQNITNHPKVTEDSASS